MPWENLMPPYGLVDLTDTGSHCKSTRSASAYLGQGLQLHIAVHQTSNKFWLALILSLCSIILLSASKPDAGNLHLFCTVPAADGCSVFVCYGVVIKQSPAEQLCAIGF